MATTTSRSVSPRLTSRAMLWPISKLMNWWMNCYQKLNVCRYAPGYGWMQLPFHLQIPPGAESFSQWGKTQSIGGSPSSKKSRNTTGNCRLGGFFYSQRPVPGLPGRLLPLMGAWALWEPSGKKESIDTKLNRQAGAFICNVCLQFVSLSRKGFCH